MTPAVVLAASLALAPAVSPPGIEAPAEVPCENFVQVGPDLYRGAEPDDACLDHLAALGMMKRFIEEFGAAGSQQMFPGRDIDTIDPAE